jgi:hypothetical protein
MRQGKQQIACENKRQTRLSKLFHCLFYYLWYVERYTVTFPFSFLPIQPSSVIIRNYSVTLRQLFTRKNAAILTEPITPRSSKPDTMCAAIWRMCLRNNKTRLSCINN